MHNPCQSRRRNSGGNDDPAWFFEGVEDVDVIIEFVDGTEEDIVFVNNAEEMVLVETLVGVSEISCFSVALVSSSVADDCVVVDCVPLGLAWGDCVVWFIEGGEDVDEIIEFVDGTLEDSGFVNNVDEMVLVETSVGAPEISCFSVALVTSRVADDWDVVDCVPLGLAWGDCVVWFFEGGEDVDVIIEFVDGTLEDSRFVKNVDEMVLVKTSVGVPEISCFSVALVTSRVADDWVVVDCVPLGLAWGDCVVWFLEGVDVDVIIEFVDGTEEDTGFVNNAEEMVLLETLVGVTEISCFSVSLDTYSVSDECVVVDCVPLELPLWSDCVVCIAVDTIVDFVVVVVVVVGLEWELTSTPSELIETVEEGVDIEDVDFSVDAFTGKLVVVIGGVSDVPVMLQSLKKTNNN